MDRLNMLLNRCKCGVFISVNEHRSDYNTVEEHFDALHNGDEEKAEIDPGIFKVMADTNRIIHIQCYPDSPVSFVQVYHFDLGAAIAQIMVEIEECWPK